MAFWEQDGFDVRLEWGPEGVRGLTPTSAVVVIVDVLTFSTAVDVAVSAGVEVYPYRYRDASAEQLARDTDAQLAVNREDATPDSPYSLSPASLRHIPQGSRLVLPSPNGATLSAIAAESEALIIAGCLRNASAVARFASQAGRPIALIPSGEHWHRDDSLRPALEDLLGAGAIVSSLGTTAGQLSPEAGAAMMTFRALATAIRPMLMECTSGRELRERGYAYDVEIATEVDASTVVPVLVDGAFRSAV